jgi:hypothetical protein
MNNDNTDNGRLVVLVVVAWMAWMSWKFGDDFDPVRLGNIWPVLLALLWWCLWPALDFLAVQERPSFFNPDDVSIWWATWYTKWGGVAAILGFGYLGKKLFQNDY